MTRNRPLVQQYDLYTAEDFQVWRILFERQSKLLQQHASPEYLQALTQIGFNADEIPHIGNTNEVLRNYTGWALQVVPEIVPQKEFFELLARKIFPATCWLRKMEELDYIEEPDMFHDVFGHAPLLVNEQYALFLEGFGKLALKWITNPEAIQLLSRIYWFTIEFGLLYDGGKLKVYGAGIMSSVEETRNSTQGIVPVYDFDIEQLLRTDYSTDALQNQYFAGTSFDELYNSLAMIEKQLTGIMLKEVAGQLKD